MGNPRVAVVTGAAGGIGLAVVEELCHSGYVVVAIDAPHEHETEGHRTTNGGASMVLEELVVRFPDQIRAHNLDVSDRDGLREICERTASEHGHVDACVAAAAIIEGGEALWEMSPDRFGNLCEVNIAGVWNTITAVIPLMLRNNAPQDCRFVAVASAAAHRGHFGLAAYGATKHAVVGLVEGLAADLVGTGVTAVAVSPGATRTPMLERTAALYGVENIEDFRQSNHLRRILEPEELAKTLAFCCSPEAGILNGSVVVATGGL